VEIERKFLTPRVPGKLERCRSCEIEQGYLATGEESEVRLRKIGELMLLTVKRGSGRERMEEEIEITRSQYRALWPLSEGRRIAKRRFYMSIGEHVAEVDVYAGELAGLVTAEVEFPSHGDSADFAPPEWFGIEVTEDPRFANQALAGTKGLPEVEG
jgi:adenylate cyclase